MDKKESILIVDDDESICRSLSLILGKRGYETETAKTGREALEKVQERFFNVALLDIRLPDMEGIELLEPLKKMQPEMAVIVVTAYASLDTAMQALNEGVQAYITKPFNVQEVLATLNEALEKQRLVMENRRLYEEAQRELAERKRAEHELGERVKELTCLYRITNITERRGVNLLEVYQEVANLLPSGWQYPEITCARIIFGNKEFKTDNFKTTKWKQSANICVNGQKEGTVEVYYLEARPEIDEGPFTKEERLLIEAVAKRLGDITERKQAEEALKRYSEKLQELIDDITKAIALTTELRDPYTSSHQQRVTRLACAIAKEMGLSEEVIAEIRVAGSLHDIGKMYIPSEILTKPGRLTETEFNMIKTHPKVGYDILKTIEFPWPIAPIVLQHHERANGSGYPSGLSAKDVLLEARILAVADVVEAMASHRPYRPAHGLEKALQEISQKRGTLYDPEVVDACLRLFSEKRFKFG
ncbi:MAG: HD domain-containing phosphohydrolase [Dehalococcoidales bacterium]